MKRTECRTAVGLVLVSLAIAVGAAGVVEPTAQHPPRVGGSSHEAEGTSGAFLAPGPALESRQHPATLHPAPDLVHASERLEGTAAASGHAEARSVEEESFVSRAAAPGGGVSLRPAHLEVGTDGLPASGMLCSRDGGTFQCGACRTDSDCPAGTGCVANRETRRFECMPSECEEDAHCFPGLVCRRVSRWGAGAVIRRCVPVGPRDEGQTCDTQFVSVAGACREGLLCHRGLCSRPCRPEDTASCPGGFACEEDEDGAACFPDCRVVGCSGGQQCKRLNNGASECLTEVRGDCPETTCGPGERCNMRLARGHGVFWCARVCDPLRADSCPADQLCGIGGGTVSTCYPRCDPMDPDSCGEGSKCTTISEDLSQWGCRPTGPAGL